MTLQRILFFVVLRFSIHPLHPIKPLWVNKNFYQGWGCWAYKTHTAITNWSGSLIITAWCPQVVDGGSSIQIWRVVATISYNHVWRAYGVILRLTGTGQRVNNSAQRTSVFQNVIQGLGLGWIPWNLRNGKQTQDLEIEISGVSAGQAYWNEYSEN